MWAISMEILHCITHVFIDIYPWQNISLKIKLYYSLLIVMDKLHWIYVHHEKCHFNWMVCCIVLFWNRSQMNSIWIDLAKEQGQHDRIIPFEEHNQYSTMAVCNIMSSSSTQSVIDIRELQFEKCLESNQRKEVRGVHWKYSFWKSSVDCRFGVWSITTHLLWLKYSNYARILTRLASSNMKSIRWSKSTRLSSFIFKIFS